jgi:hypothetical protein
VGELEELEDGDGETVVEGEALGNVGDAGAGFARGLAKDFHRALLRGEEAEENLEEGGFAAAVRADDGGDGFLGNGEGDVFEDRFGGAVGEPEVFGVDCPRFGHGVRGPRRRRRGP